MSKYLIINADDYGMSQSTNEAVEELFEVGYITSTTLMTPCPWAEDAVARAKKNPKMRVGLHTTLTSEWEGYRWGPVARTAVPSLLDSDGYLPRTCEELLKTCTDADVETELNVQLDYMLHRDLKPTHVDNHMGSVYGLEGRPLFEQVFKLCARGGYAIRLPRNLEMFGQVPPELAGILGQVIGAADSMGIGTLDYLCQNDTRFQESDGYDALKRSYLDIIAKLPEGVSEMYMHPAADSPELRRITDYWYTRVWEYRLLKDPDLMAAIEAAGAVLTTWIEAPLKGRKAAV